MNINFNSYYLGNANKTFFWLPMDTLELYQKNLVDNFDLLKTNDWINKEIQYRFNSFGFRCDEFTQDKNILFLGCSFTIGIGIPAETRWTDIVAKHLNLKCYNLGIGGSSSDTAFRLGLKWIDILNPSIVIFRKPYGIRLEIISSKEINMLNIISSDYQDFFKKYAFDDMNHDLNSIKNELALKYLCQVKNIKIIVVDDTNRFPVYDLARDLAHSGIKTNQSYADYMLTLI